MPFDRAEAREMGRKGGKTRVAKTKLESFRGDPLGFIRALVDPETGRPFALYPAEETFLREALTLKDGRAPYPELVFSAPKKSGKTALAALAMLYLVRVEGGKYAEGYCVANDLEQATGRVFKACKRIIKASPLLRGKGVDLKKWVITFKATGGTIEAIGSSYASAAGANPTAVAFDELWANTSERSHRLWDELVPVPTRDLSVRLTTTYAGFEGESDLLEGLYKRGLKGELIAPDLYSAGDLLMFWSHVPVAPWQTDRWLTQMRGQLRPNAFLRMIENRFVSSESAFVPPEWWQACESAELRPVVMDRELPVWVGVDASVKRDSTAIVAVTWDAEAKRVRLVWHKSWQPSPEDPLDFEATIETTLRELRGRFRVNRVLYDPYQLVSSAQRLTRDGLRMEEFPQTLPNLTAASSNLYDLIKGRNLSVYVDEQLQRSINRAVALEGSRGWHITKEKSSHKIDLVVALAQAALAAVRGQNTQEVNHASVMETLMNLRKPPADSSLGWNPGPFHSGGPRHLQSAFGPFRTRPK